MTISGWLAGATAALQESGLDSARLDALILLEDATGHDRAWLLAHPEQELSMAQLEPLADRLERRLQHEPLAYIRGHSEFYGRRFEVTPDVLVPRPETETMITLLKKIALSGDTVADIGTGSGALAITAVLETGAVAAAVDIDEACLAVAKRNAVVYTTPLQVFQGDLLEPFLAPNSQFAPKIILANLPYVPLGYPINDAAEHEPALALYGGDDGLDLYRRMFDQIKLLPKTPQFVLSEALPQQHPALQLLAEAAGYHLQSSDDFIQLFRH